MDYFEEAHEEIQGLYHRRRWEEKVLSASKDWTDDEGAKDAYAWYVGDKELDKWLFLGATVDELPDDRFEYHDDELYLSVMDHGIPWSSIEADGGAEAKAVAAKHSKKRVTAKHPITGEVFDITELKERKVRILHDVNDLTPVIEEFNEVEPGKFKSFSEFKEEIYEYVKWYSQGGELEAEQFLNSFVCETRSKVIHMGVSAAFFSTEQSRSTLLNEVILPLVEGVKPEKIAIIGPAWGSGADEYILEDDRLEIVFLDQEIIQVYRADMDKDYIADSIEIGEFEEDKEPDWERMEFVQPAWDAMK